jgi:hypothetical protein
MSPVTIVNSVRGNTTDRDVAIAVGREYVFGETNSGKLDSSLPPQNPLLTSTVPSGGAAVVSPTFGSGLWTIDYSPRASYKYIVRSFSTIAPPGHVITAGEDVVTLGHLTMEHTQQQRR